MTGELKIEGSMGVALKIGQLIEDQRNFPSGALARNKIVIVGGC
jgi:hypothetical protein